MKYLKQLLIILCICVVGETICQLLPFSFPGSIMAMLILSVLLVSKVVKEKQIQEVGDYLLEMIGLCIVPSCVSIIEHMELIQRIAVPLFIINLLVFILTFLTCVITIRWTMRWFVKKGVE